jgi:ubiquinone/menaquinone biosynthesis C-methylase UbiE
MNFISKAFVAVLNISPRFKKVLWKRVYQFLASRYPTGEWTFMNYGFARLDGNQPELKNEDEKNRYFIQLYDHVVSSVSLKGKKVLEIGSGRGGGSEYIKRYFNLNEMIGLDYSENAVNFCEKNYSTEGLSFKYGDAEKLPFGDSSFDSVVNVESSHCYSSVPQFVKEVERVLKPGGYFLFADFRDLVDFNILEEILLGSGLEVIKKENISKQVVHGLDEFNVEKMARFQAVFRSWLKKPLYEFAGMKGSTMYEALKSGETVYYHYTLRKSE